MSSSVPAKARPTTNQLTGQTNSDSETVPGPDEVPIHASIQPVISHVMASSQLLVVAISLDTERGDVWHCVEYKHNGQVVQYTLRVMSSFEARPAEGPPLVTRMLSPPPVPTAFMFEPPPSGRNGAGSSASSA
jgi:hypothetical protein